MRILLVDDSNVALSGTINDLRTRHRFDVVHAIDPQTARKHLYGERFDVVLVDVLYLPLTRAYGQKRREGRISLRDDQQFLASGLAVLDDVSELDERPATVVWTVGDANRELHMLYAYQEFGVSAFCSKGP